ncbi:two-component system sensor histidine kinase NtrB [Deferrisoma palaeochoriense]
MDVSAIKYAISDALWEGLPVAAFLTDETGRIVGWNPAAEVLTGRLASEVEGQPWAEALGVSGGGVTEPGSARGEAWAETLCTAHRADGRSIRLRLRSRAVRDTAGRPLGRLWLATDVSLRDAVDRKLVQYERLATLGELAASVVHEVGNPVSVILGFAALLRDDAGADPDGAIRDRIYEEAQRCRTLIDQLLGYARSATGRSDPGPVQVPDVVGETLALVRYRFQRAGVGVETRWGEGGLSVWADASELKQVVLNLLLNAADVSPPGGVVEVECTGFEREEQRGGDSLLDPVLRVERVPWVRLRVGDRGPGFGGQDPERFFDPFVTTKEGGGGLGLTVCRRLVGSWGGEIRLEEREGGGAWAVVELPGHRG